MKALGEIALSENNPSGAIAHFEKAIQLDPNYFASYLARETCKAQ